MDLTITQWQKLLGCKTQTELAQLLRVRKEAITEWKYGRQKIPPYFVQALRVLNAIRKDAIAFQDWDKNKRNFLR